MEQINRTTAFGTWRFAHQYERAARAVDAIAKTDLDVAAPRYYLLGHSIELALKAFLLARNVPHEELRSMKLMGHDLEKALARAEGVGLQEFVEFSLEERASIELLNKTYQPKEHEYIVTGYTAWPQTAVLLAILEKLLPSIKSECLEATLKQSGSE